MCLFYFIFLLLFFFKFKQTFMKKEKAKKNMLESLGGLPILEASRLIDHKEMLVVSLTFT